MDSLFGVTPLSLALDDFRSYAIDSDKLLPELIKLANNGRVFVWGNIQGLTPQQALDAMHAAASIRGRTAKQIHDLFVGVSGFLNMIQPGCVPSPEPPPGWRLTWDAAEKGTATQLVPTTIVLTPASDTLQNGASVQFAAVVNDQFGAPVSPQPAVSWAAGTGTVDQSGTYTAPAAAGTDTVTATLGVLSATANITVQ